MQPTNVTQVEAPNTTAVGGEPRYAGFLIRLWAYIIDGLILGIAGGILAYFLGNWVQILFVLIAWLYFALMESGPKQATLGKQATGLKVTDLGGARLTFARATGRYFAKILSSIILCIGFLMIAWTKKKQGLHDILAKTLVVKNS